MKTRIPAGARRCLPALLTTLAVMALAPAAHASVTGYNEPAYTKTSGNNSYWWAWNAVTGANSDGSTNYTYYLCFDVYRAGIKVESSNGTNGPSTQNCTGSLRGGASPSSGNYGAVPFTTGTVLEDGVNYYICAGGWYRNFYIWSHDNAGSNKCPSSTIDRNKPQITTSMASGAQFTKNPVIPVRINYTDPTSPPWFGSDGLASNWVCVTLGTTCSPGGQRNQHCSAPNVANNRINSFDCSADVTTQPDGRWYFCAVSADAAVPDNMAGPNQFQNAFSNNANLSNSVCDDIVVDRGAPQVTAQADRTTVNVGDLVNFSASATDSLSGVSGQFAWDFGDNTAPGSGANTSHTYTQAGTYVARATTSDGAGNSGQGTVTITVNTPPSGGGGGGGGTPGGGGGTPGDGGGGGDPGGGGGGTPGGGGGGTPGGGGGGTPGGGDTGQTGGGSNPGTPDGTTGAAPVQQPISPNDVSKNAGGGGAQETSVGALDVIAPKRVSIRRTRRLLLALTADVGGRVDVALLRGSRIVSRKGATLGGPGTYSLRVPLSRRLRNGRYVLKVSFTPAGASRATTKTLRVRIVGARRPRSRSRRSVVAGNSGPLRGTAGGIYVAATGDARARTVVVR